MELVYSSNRLENAAVSLSEDSRLFGVPIGRKYIQRIAVLRATEKFTQLFGYRALRIHPLKGDRAGQHALTLTGNDRLMIEKNQEDKVRIVKVEDYHGDQIDPASPSPLGMGDFAWRGTMGDISYI